jgi:hypothetical protein
MNPRNAHRLLAAVSVATLLLAADTALLLLPSNVAAQTTARVSGRVVDRLSARGIAGAKLTLVGTTSIAAADSAGRYAFVGIPTGHLNFFVRAIGYRPAQAALDVAAGEDLRLDVSLDSIAADPSAQILPTVAVTTAAGLVEHRLADFERRRRTGRGQYLTEDEIRRSGAANIADATRGMRGVSVHCGGGGGCRVQMIRAPMNCLPEYVIDGQVDNVFGPVTPIRDIAGLEVYTGPSDVPGEFAGTNAGCGVIVVWTRSGPPRRPF